MSIKQIFSKKSTKIIAVVAVLSVVLSVTGVHVYLYHKNAEMIAAVFVAIAIVAVLTLISDVYLTVRTHNLIHLRLKKHKSKNNPCQLTDYKETEMFEVLLLCIPKRWFLISHNNQKYVINDNGCFYITDDEFKKHYVYNCPDNSDNFESSLLIKYYAQENGLIADVHKSPFLANKDGYVLIKTSDSYTIGDSVMSFEIAEKEALEIIEGTADIKAVFQKQLKSAIERGHAKNET